jgi:cysteine synthase A
MAKILVANTPNSISLDQFGNQSNPDAHAASTAMEILRDAAGEVDIFVAGVGTGGSISGIGGALKRFNNNIQVVAVEPHSCPMLSQGVKGVHAIQGLSSGHIPDILDQSVIDEVQTVTDQDAISMARDLAKIEGMPVGISSGATVSAALRLSLMPKNKDKNIVVILADTAERYYSTELFSS